jgi:hypothetical protein
VEGTTGLTAAPEPRAIAERIDQLAADADGARRMGTAGHDLVRDVVPAWPQIVARLLD